MGFLAPLLNRNLHVGILRFGRCCVAQGEGRKCFLSPDRAQTNWVLILVPARISKLGAEALTPTLFLRGGSEGLGHRQPQWVETGKKSLSLPPVAGHCPPSWETEAALTGRGAAVASTLAPMPSLPSCWGWGRGTLPKKALVRTRLR